MPHLFGGPKMYLHLFDGSQHLFAFIWVLRGSKIIYLHSIMIYLMVPNIYLHLFDGPQLICIYLEFFFYIHTHSQL